MIIAIDGPAASGKSTTARLVARELGFTYLDTGAMYRAVTLAVLENGLNIVDEAPLSDLLGRLDLHLSTSDGETRITLDGRDVSQDIRSIDVTAKVSAVSAAPIVRQAMVPLQRRIAATRNCVVEGRDIGTVVFPEARFKFFIVADYEARARRRQLDLERLGETRSLDELIADLKMRDQKDSSRDHSPLRKAEDAREIDTSNLTINEQVTLIVEQVKNQLANRKPND